MKTVTLLTTIILFCACHTDKDVNPLVGSWKYHSVDIIEVSSELNSVLSAVDKYCSNYSSDTLSVYDDGTFRFPSERSAEWSGWWYYDEQHITLLGDHIEIWEDIVCTEDKLIFTVNQAALFYDLYGFILNAVILRFEYKNINKKR